MQTKTPLYRTLCVRVVAGQTTNTMHYRAALMSYLISECQQDLYTARVTIDVILIADRIPMEFFSVLWSIVLLYNKSCAC